MTDPVHIPDGSPDLQHWDDDRHGSVTYRILVDADGGPSRGLVQGIAYLEPGDRENMHTHDIPETIHVLEGSGEARLQGNSLPLAPGDTLFVPAGAPHAWSAAEAEGLTLLFTFPTDRFAEVAYHFDAAA
ncbi:cupin domain-containing protein [Histidinibacterium lentulum]|uniref:Cupin domain-containing protein n=1 Tax=Histidinibacterium lentulum TaxID=2480588 RepID=A0A3N2R115_9RHOB|nr:cupin domain-containing protein [Histidinibacterium lentulum]ROU01164.1 cupin domain-containing protein [Histidinibacterium lentulum]